MRHTLKWSLFVGVSVAGVVLAALKLFQPIGYWHLVLFGYAFVCASVAAGYVVHRNLEKRNFGKANNAVKTDGGKMETQNIAVRRIPIGGNRADEMQERNSEEILENPAESGALKQNKSGVPEFVPASQLLREQQNPNDNKISDNDKPLENKELAAEKFLEEIEKDEIEAEILKTEGAMENNSQPNMAGAGGCAFRKDFHEHLGRQARVFTKDGKTICGKFAGMDTHVVLENALCGAERKSLLMISKDEITRMEVE